MLSADAHRIAVRIAYNQLVTNVAPSAAPQSHALDRRERTKTIVWVMSTLGFIRNYAATLTLLEQEGYRLHFVYVHPKTAEFWSAHLAETCPRATFSHGPQPHKGHWRPFAEKVRLAIDYVRYMDSRYDRAQFLRGNIESVTSRWLRVPLAPVKLLGDRGVRLVIAFLQRVEAAIPVSPAVDELLEELNPDLLIVTPLINWGSRQVDYVKAARALGIPTALAVASWDNLTNKGHMRVVPDRVFVWNEAQKEEAVSMHGVPSSQVVITGAQLFDHWFGRSPERAREELCRAAGLDPDRPFVLFLGSTTGVVPREVDFVERWVRLLRNADDPSVAGVGILIRPHPAGTARYLGLDLSQFENVRIWPEPTLDPTVSFDDQGRQDFFDSLYYCDVAVGANTSALIDAAIVGRTVCTVDAPEFEQSQEGTLHFAYLADEASGVLRVARDMDEHIAQLADVLAGNRAADERAQAFVRDFIRPFGIERPAAPILAAAIEEAASLHVEARHRSAAARVAMVLLDPIARLTSRIPAKTPPQPIPWWQRALRPAVTLWVNCVVVTTAARRNVRSQKKRLSRATRRAGRRLLRA
jgi:hypothetical protein